MVELWYIWINITERQHIDIYGKEHDYYKIVHEITSKHMEFGNCYQLTLYGMQNYFGRYIDENVTNIEKYQHMNVAVGYDMVLKIYQEKGILFKINENRLYHDKCEIWKDGEFIDMIDELRQKYNELCNDKYVSDYLIEYDNLLIKDLMKIVAEYVHTKPKNMENVIDEFVDTDGANVDELIDKMKN